MQVHWREHRTWLVAGGSAAVIIIVVIILIVHAVGRHSTKLLQTAASSAPGDYLTLLNRGKAQLDHLDYPNAIASFQKATQIAPTDENTWRDLADAYLRAGQSESAIDAARKVLALNHNSAAAYYIEGSAQLRVGQSEEAVKSLSACEETSPEIAAVHFQLGRAQQGMGHTDAAIAELRKAVEIEPEHPAAHYMLGQLLLRKGDSQSAQIELAHHEHIVSAAGNLSADPNRLEKCKFTEPVIPFTTMEQPDPHGIAVSFVDKTDKMLETGGSFKGPVGIIYIDPQRKMPDLIVRDSSGLRLLTQKGGRFEPRPQVIPLPADFTYQQILVGDLDNDGTPDFIVLGEKGSRAFALPPDGQAVDISESSGIAKIEAKSGVLADLDFTGKLALIVVRPDGNGIRAFRNQGNLTFKEQTNLPLPANVKDLGSAYVADLNGDDLPDLVVSRKNQPPLVSMNRRGQPLTSFESAKDWPAGNEIAIGDLNNDLRLDRIAAGDGKLDIISAGIAGGSVSLPADPEAHCIALFDFDNDGWLDIVAAGSNSLHVWRNLGLGKFKEVSKALGLASVGNDVTQIITVDFDGDGAVDLILAHADGRLQLLHNQGGSANHSISLRLKGTRSNADGLGAQVELIADGWRTIRTYDQNPLTIGTGKHTKLDRLTVHWFDLAVSSADIDVTSSGPTTITEPQLPTGSCPNLYAWDGHRFRYITDILGSSPMGLPVAPAHYIDADTNERVWLGNDAMFPPHDGKYQVAITDELREVIYLDEAKLIVVDHPAGTEVQSLDKLVPKKPFPTKGVITLANRHPLISAIRSDGADVTASLQENDLQLVSPVHLRPPELRGLAEPWSVTLDFGPLPVDRPLVLALSGWMHFGGGMANIAAADNPDLPFPFPMLEVQTPDGWKPVAVTVGAPAGKTKTIVVDLTGKLPAGSQKLRLSTAFEIHWDRIALFEKSPTEATEQTFAPTEAVLSWHGFGQYEDRPWTQPLTPIYDRVAQTPPWVVTPSGWCTRYGDVRELLAKQDDALVILDAGDEVKLSFDASALPPKAPGMQRDFFLYTDGWDKDADYHVAFGDTVGPMPFHRMNDQEYGRDDRNHTKAKWESRYNTRWVSGQTLQRQEGR